MLKKINNITNDMVIRFILVGIALFITDYLLFDDKRGSQNQVNNQQFYSYLNDRFELHEQSQVEAYLARMSQEQQDELIEQFIDDTLLYQFALDHQLERTDGQLKKAISDKGRELLEIMTYARMAPISDSDVAKYYHDNIERYSKDAQVDMYVRHYDNVEHAKQDLSKLNHGEHVPLTRVESFTRPFIEYGVGIKDVSRFYSATMADRVFDYQGENSKWFGPFASKDHYHLYSVTAFTPSQVTPLVDVEESIRRYLTSNAQEKALIKELSQKRAASNLTNNVVFNHD
ncbi:peptidylprolyl isomerase [Vibrio agarivorans]|uniref:Peptidylprolyl isomerase n=1 Tax=Vibrio agarivorans TaxID=153622 RepID=A0ABT7Y632_9VIBR|nr:peptidylprolyl isomerase [Vibrio agarivorans]MDN2483501.1 peptidylprolyl isomerase [Vibrio agarivorans]